MQGELKKTCINIIKYSTRIKNMDELQRILDAYKKRDLHSIDERQYQFTRYRVHTQRERERVYSSIVKHYIPDITGAKIMEIGAGGGINLLFFKAMGFKAGNIYANDLRPQKGEQLKTILPDSYINTGNALDLPLSEDFDICFQATVFTSILDEGLKQKIAQHMFDMTRKNGIVLWYDFIYDNPWNKDVKGIKPKEVKQLFPKAKQIRFYNIMLAPPIGRRVGRLYPFFNFLLPFLRSHIVAVIEK